ncbi:MAG: hypothetical protein JKY81_04535 [Colwellia sp.]|nr:hypothetical protein [Colwellia sp.]
MPVTVDPRLYPIPQDLQKIPEVRKYFEDLERFLHDLWFRTGGGDDAVAEAQIGELYEPGIQTSNADELIEEVEVSQEMSFFHDFTERLEELESVNQIPTPTAAVEVITASSNTTTTGDQVVICTNTSSITVTLNATPEDGEAVHIKRQNTGAVTVSGDIDGSTTLVIGLRYSSPHLVYTVDAGEWSIV